MLKKPGNQELNKRTTIIGKVSLNHKGLSMSQNANN